MASSCALSWTMANSGVASVTRRLLPILDWIPGYGRDWLLPNVLAGLALWAVMIPEGMAYAGIIVEGVPPIIGHYTILPALLAYPRHVVATAFFQLGQELSNLDQNK
jgi:hypothetical protein